MWQLSQACPAPSAKSLQWWEARLPSAILVSCLLPLGLANKPSGVSKAPWVPTFLTAWVPPKRARMKRKASRESCSQTPDETHSNPVPGHARRSCSTTGKGSQEKGHSPQLPARRGGCQHEGGGPLEAWDERAAGWPWVHAGAQDAASSSWTPGSSGLLTPSPHPSFLVGRHQEKRTSGARIFTQEGRTHRHSYPSALTSLLHLLPQACTYLVAPCWSPSPQISSHKPPWLPTAQR